MNWLERIPMLSINPDAASRDDVARLSADLMACRHELYRLRDLVGSVDAEIIDELLKGPSEE